MKIKNWIGVFTCLCASLVIQPVFANIAATPDKYTLYISSSEIAQFESEGRVNALQSNSLTSIDVERTAKTTRYAAKGHGLSIKSSSGASAVIGNPDGAVVEIPPYLRDNASQQIIDSPLPAFMLNSIHAALAESLKMPALSADKSSNAWSLAMNPEIPTIQFINFPNTKIEVKKLIDGRLELTASIQGLKYSSPNMREANLNIRLVTVVDRDWTRTTAFSLRGEGDYVDLSGRPGRFHFSRVNESALSKKNLKPAQADVDKLPETAALLTDNPPLAEFSVVISLWSASAGAAAERRTNPSLLDTIVAQVREKALNVLVEMGVEKSVAESLLTREVIVGGLSKLEPGALIAFGGGGSVTKTLHVLNNVGWVNISRKDAEIIGKTVENVVASALTVKGAISTGRAVVVGETNKAVKWLKENKAYLGAAYDLVSTGLGMIKNLPKDAVVSDPLPPNFPQVNPNPLGFPQEWLDLWSDHLEISQKVQSLRQTAYKINQESDALLKQAREVLENQVSKNSNQYAHIMALVNASDIRSILEAFNKIRALETESVDFATTFVDPFLLKAQGLALRAQSVMSEARESAAAAQQWANFAAGKDDTYKRSFVDLATILNQAPSWFPRVDSLPDTLRSLRDSYQPPNFSQAYSQLDQNLNYQRAQQQEADLMATLEVGSNVPDVWNTDSVVATSDISIGTPITDLLGYQPTPEVLGLNPSNVSPPAEILPPPAVVSPPPPAGNLLRSFVLTEHDHLGVPSGEQVLIKGSYGNSTQFAFDGSGNIGQMRNDPEAWTVDAATTSIENAGQDATTGIRWARWSGAAGGVDPARYIVITQDGQPEAQEQIVGAVHVIVGPELSASATTLPLSGIVNYVHAGGTTPTDNNLNAGNLLSATLSADFTNHTVDAAVVAQVGATTLTATGTDMPINLSTVSFGGSTADGKVGVGCAGACGAANIGVIQGFFAGTNAQGAGMAYSVNTSAGAGDSGTTISGTAAFHR